MAKKPEDRDTISKRLAETTKETQRLKEELENLIAAGIPGRLKVPITQRSAERSPPTSLPSGSLSTNKIQIIKSYDSKCSQHPQNLKKPKNEQISTPKESVSPQRLKNYDVQQTRDYIKKQRDKRMAEVKKLKKNDSKTSSELRKEKLQELHQKASELVKRNIEAKRSRSKSNERPILHTRSIEPVLDKTSRPSIIQGYNCAERSKNLAGNLKLFNVKCTKSSLQPPSPSEEVVETETKSRQRSQNEFHLHVPKRDRNQLQVPNWMSNFHNQQSDNSNFPMKTKAKSCEELTRDINISFMQPKKQSSAIIFSKSNESQKSISKTKKAEKSVELAAVTEEINLKPVETFPDWLTQTTPQIDPHNFINTVKRQLFPRSSTGSEPKNLFSNTENLQLLKPNTFEKTPTEKQSFNSHSKQQEIEQQDGGAKTNDVGEEIRQPDIQCNHRSKRDEDMIKKKKVHSKISNSESDTTRDIPSISSEYDLMSKRIIEKIDNLLVPKNDDDDVKSGQEEQTEYEYTFECTKPTTTDKLSIRTILSDIEKDSNTKHTITTHKTKTSDGSSNRSEHVNPDLIKSNADDINNAILIKSNQTGEENRNYLSLNEPKMSLKISSNQKINKQNIVKNITFRQEQNLTGTKEHANELHLKFEAEIHLLNDFNKSLRHFSEIEKAFESLRLKQNNTEMITKKIVQNRDTQTSVITKTAASSSSHSQSSKLSETRHEITSQISTINYSRGSGVVEEFEHQQLKENDTADGYNNNEQKSLVNFDLNALELTDKTEWNQLLESVDLNDTLLDSYSCDTLKHFEYVQDENSLFKNFAGISVKMFDQLIKDEDIRIENLKKMVKFREQALLDKTRSELVWLDMQKKQFIKTKRLDEVSMIKRKQRGILLRLQQERQEMQRLKQMQKEASKKRKIVLKQQRNHIKNQLHSDNMLSKLKTNNNNYRERNERRASGPLKVIQPVPPTKSFSFDTTNNDQNQINNNQHSEAKSAMSFKTLGTATCSALSELSVENDQKPINSETFSTVCKNLLMRQEALKKRRKKVEGLLQWHNELLQEENAIKTLENKMKTIVSRIPNVEEDYGGSEGDGRGSDDGQHHHHQPQKQQQEDPEIVEKEPMIVLPLKEKGKDMDVIKIKLTSSSSSSSVTSSLNDNHNSSIKVKESQNIPAQSKTDPDETIGTETINYSADFEPEDDKSSISSISQLIEDFTKIEGNIKTLSLAYKEEEKPLEEEKNEQQQDENEEKTAHDTIGIVSVRVDSPNSSINSEDLDVASSQSKNDKLIEGDHVINEICDTIHLSLQLEPPLATDSETSTPLQITEDNSIKEPSSSIIEEDVMVSKIEEKDSNENEENAITDNVKIDFPSDSSHSMSEDNSNSNVLEQIETDHNVSIQSVEEAQQQSTASPLHYTETQETSDEQNEEKMVESLNVEPLTDQQINDDNNQSTIESEMIPIESCPSNNNHQHSENKTDEEKVASLSNQIKSHKQNSNSDLVPSVVILSNVCVKSASGSAAAAAAVDEYSLHTSISSEILSIEEEEEQQATVEENEAEPIENESEKTTSPTNFETVEQEGMKSKRLLESFNDHHLVPPGSRKYLVEKRSMELAFTSGGGGVGNASGSSSSSSSSSGGSPSPTRSLACSSRKKSPADVKKRVRDILNDTSPKVNHHKNGRFQDLCTMTYDLSPIHSPDSSGSSSIENRSASLGNEAEELLKKQIAIEQEIKLLTEQQQKQQASLMYIREIPNKPPPPYTPPSSKIKSKKSPSVEPNTKEEIQQITEYSAKIIHKAYLSNNLDNLCISDKTLSLIAKNIDKACYKFVFDLCKEIALEHYNFYTREIPGPSWLKIEKKPFTTTFQTIPITAKDLQQLMNKKLLELFNFQKPEVKKENSIMKWSRKKRDHVDEVLLQEMQNEESLWTNFDQDELILKDKITNEIMAMLLKDTAQVLEKTIRRKVEKSNSYNTNV